MPGTLVRDSLAYTLINATVSADTTHTAVQVSKPGLVGVHVLVTGVVTGSSTPTLNIEVQGADDSAFTTNVVSHGRFKALVAADASSAFEHKLVVMSQKQYMRAVSVVSGTSPVFTTVQCKVRTPHDRRIAATQTA